MIKKIIIFNYIITNLIWAAFIFVGVLSFTFQSFFQNIEISYIDNLLLLTICLVCFYSGYLIRYNNYYLLIITTIILGINIDLNSIQIINFNILNLLIVGGTETIGYSFFILYPEANLKLSGCEISFNQFSVNIYNLISLSVIFYYIYRYNEPINTEINSK